MPQGSEIGSAYLTIKAQPDAQFANEIGEMGTDAGGIFSDKFGAVMGKLPGILAAAGVGVAIGKELFDVGKTFDAMRDKIVVGTGASGEALESLVDSAKAIGTSVPTDFEKVGDVVQNLNTRLGITGDELESLGSRVIEAGNLLGSELDLDKLTGAFNAFGVSNEEAAGKLDYLFNVGQSTGIAMNSLMGIMESAAPTMQMLGFSFEETANMAALLDKAGMDASGTMSKMNKALVELAQPGESAANAYQRLIEEMGAYLEKGDEAAALDIAGKVFGTRGAAQFVGALKSGALSMDEIKDAALGAGDGILGTMDRTKSFDESLQILKNTLLVAIEPAATAVFQGISDAIENVTAFVKDNQEAFDALGSVLGTVANIIGTVLGGAFQLIGGIIVGLGQSVKDLQTIFTTLADAVKGAFDTVVSVVTGAINTIKNLFNFKFELPHIPLPHFAVNPPGWQLGDLLKGQLPSLGIEWYAKGGIVNGATLIGAGEAGPEAIVPLTAPNIAPFADAVASRVGRSSIYIENMNVEADDVDELILSINRRLAELGAM